MAKRISKKHPGWPGLSPLAVENIWELAGQRFDYNYDSLDRLTSEEKKTSGEERIYKIEYKFDDNQAKNGNIHQVIVNETDTTTFTYDEMNQLTGITNRDSSTETLTYDDNGNLTQTSHNGEITSYQWDCNDRLTKVTNSNGEITEFTYDSDGMLVKEVSSGMERKFIQNNRYATRELAKNNRGEWEVSAQHIVHGTMLSTYISPASSNHPKSKNKNQNNRTDTIFYHTDHLGSVRLITDRNGNIIDSISTDAYGNPLPHAASTGGKGAKMLQEFNFVGTHGIRYVNKIRMHNMRARWYNLAMATFLSMDIVLDINRYSYVRDNPINRIDYSGKSTFYMNTANRAQSKRINVLQKIYNKFRKILDARIYSTEGKKLLNCGEMIELLSDAIDHLLSLDCIEMKDFVDIFGILTVSEFPGSVLATMYPQESKNQRDMLGKFSMTTWWLEEDFKDEYKDVADAKSNQVRHYLAYAFIAFASESGVLSNILVIQHELDDQFKNTPDIKLGFLGTGRGKILVNIKNNCMGLSAGPKRRKECLRKNKNKILKEFRKACIT